MTSFSPDAFPLVLPRDPLCYCITTMESGQILAEVRIFVDNGSYNLSVTMSKLEAKPGHTVR